MYVFLHFLVLVLNYELIHLMLFVLSLFQINLSNLSGRRLHDKST